jgi:hypothetical protein
MVPVIIEKAASLRAASAAESEMPSPEPRTEFARGSPSSESHVCFFGVRVLTPFALEDALRVSNRRCSSLPRCHRVRASPRGPLRQADEFSPPSPSQLVNHQYCRDIAVRAGRFLFHFRRASESSMAALDTHCRHPSACAHRDPANAAEVVIRRVRRSVDNSRGLRGRGGGSCIWGRLGRGCGLWRGAGACRVGRG